MAVQFERPVKFNDADAVAQWVWLQLQSLEDALNVGQKVVKLSQSHKEPDKLEDGMIVLADGVDWNPTLGGQGYYGYYNGAWHKLG